MDDYDWNERRISDLEIEIDILEEMYKLANKIVELNGDKDAIMDYDFTIDRDEIDQAIYDRKEQRDELIEENLEISKRWTPAEKEFRRNEGV